MSVTVLSYAAPFFAVDYIENEAEYRVGPKSIVLNLSEEPVLINERPVHFFQSVVSREVVLNHCRRCLVILNRTRHGDEEALFTAIKERWTLAYDATGEERHKGVMLWRTAKEKLDDVSANLCYAGSVPLNVGLHREHWGGPPIKEVHTQLVGYGTMQQYYEKDLSTLYREELMAPGCSHIPMYDDKIDYPWHQYETITRGIFQACEMEAT